MARTPQVRGGRPVVVAMRLSEAEARRIDAVRGPLSRSAWLRWQALKVIGSDEAELTGPKPSKSGS